MQIKKTERGFDRMDFIDEYGSECSLQKSSLIDPQAIWFGVDTHFNDGKIGSRMHISQTLMKVLLPYLIQFSETGELHPPEHKCETVSCNEIATHWIEEWLGDGMTSKIMVCEKCHNRGVIEKTCVSLEKLSLDDQTECMHPNCETIANIKDRISLDNGMISHMLHCCKHYKQYNGFE